MESKDEVKKENQNRTTKMSENEKAKAQLKAEAIGRDKNFDEEPSLGGAGQVRQTGRVTDSGYSSETGSSRVRVSRNENRDYESNDLKGNFLSSLKNNKKTLLSIAGALAGGALLFKAAKGGSSSKKGKEIQLHTKQTIKRSREDLYAYWRNLENLPNFMSHIKEIDEIDARRSRWTAKIPGGLGTIDWEAIIEQDRRNEYISWRSIADSDIENAGEVRFKDARGGKGTVVETTISYRPPAGIAGEYAAKLLNPAFEKVVKKDLEQFKEHMETGREELGERILY